MSHYLAAIILAAALALCVYLLTVLWRIHFIHTSRAWKFIFCGIGLLTIECAIGTHLAYLSGQLLSVEEIIFIAVILVKAVCYAVGFTIWKKDLEWLKTLAKQRRQHMEEEDDDKLPKEHPEHPAPPTKPETPGGPKPQPQEGDDPGIPEDPGKSGQHP